MDENGWVRMGGRVWFMLIMKVTIAKWIPLIVMDAYGINGDFMNISCCDLFGIRQGVSLK